MPLDRAEVLRSMELGGRSPGLAGTAANGQEWRGKQGGKEQELTAIQKSSSGASGR